MPFWHRQEHEERTQASALAQETDPGRVAYFLLHHHFKTPLLALLPPPGGCWGGASWMPPHPTPPRPLASFETEPEVTAPLADPRLRYRNLAQTDSAQPQPHRAGRGNCDIRQREGTGGSGWQRNLPSAKRFCPQTAMVMGTACSCRAPGPQAFP